LANRLQTGGAIPTAKREGGEGPFVELSFVYMGESGDFESAWRELAPDRRKRLGRAWEDIGASLHASHVAALIAKTVRCARAGRRPD